MEAVRGYQGQLRLKLEQHQVEVKRAEQSLREAQALAAAADDTLMLKRAIESDLKYQLGELHKFLQTHDPAPAPVLQNPDPGQLQFLEELVSKPVPTVYSGVEAKRVVIEVAVALLQDGSPRSTSLIHQELEKRGIVLNVKNQLTRISQILSAHPQFNSARGIGWWLKGESPAGTGLSGATKSLEGQTTSES